MLDSFHILGLDTFYTLMLDTFHTFQLDTFHTYHTLQLDYSRSVWLENYLSALPYI